MAVEVEFVVEVVDIAAGEVDMLAEEAAFVVVEVV